MFRRCPYCGGHDVHRSRIRPLEESLRHVILSPYRCRGCRKRFWLVSSRVYRVAVLVGIAVTAGAIGVLLSGESGHAKVTPQGAAQVERTVNSAKQNDSVAEHELANMYAAGKGVPRSAKEGFAWLERAAEHGSTDAQYELATALRDGRGVIQDYGRAATWMQRAAQSGNGYAQFELGLMYRSGLGVVADNAKAYTWLNLAAAQGVGGADVVRDAMARQLSLAQISEAQAEARRLSEAQQTESGTPN